MQKLILLILAIIPGALIMLWVYRKDKIESEPKGLIARLLIYGAIACIPAVLFGVLFDIFLGWFFETETILSMILEYFIAVALVEEGCKMFMLKKITWNNKAFNYRFDAIVYAVSVGMGFAILENIIYVFQNGLMTALIRAVLSIPGHASFAICMGIFYAEAKRAEAMGNKRKKRNNLRAALLFPVLMHGFYDFALSVDSWILLLLLFISIVVTDVLCVRKIRRHSDTDDKLAPESEPFSLSNIHF